MGNGHHFPLIYHKLLSFFQSTEKQLFSHSGQFIRKVLFVIFTIIWMEKDLPDDNNCHYTICEL